MIRRLVHDSYQVTRERERGVLTHIKGTRLAEQILSRLVRELRDNIEPELRARAAEALGGLRDPQALEVLISALRKDPAGVVRLVQSIHCLLRLPRTPKRSARPPQEHLGHLAR